MASIIPIRQGRGDVDARRAADAEIAVNDAKEIAYDKQSLRRLKISDQASGAAERLRAEYLHSQNGISYAMIAGTAPVPDKWMNKRLRELGVRWTYRDFPGGGYSMEPDRGVYSKK